MALTNEQQKELITICNSIQNGDMVIFAMYQGLRKGEILGLMQDNINLDENTLTINKAWNQANEFTHTKNKQSVRTMPLFEESKNIILKRQSKTNRLFNLSNKQYELLIKEINTKTSTNIKLKDMRSTFITRCKEFEIPEHIIQAWCGHKIGSSVTSTVYTKHNKEVDDKYINILNKA